MVNKMPCFARFKWKASQSFCSVLLEFGLNLGVKPGIYFGITQESYILLADDEETIHFGSI
jgi:hypothetical protein